MPARPALRVIAVVIVDAGMVVAVGAGGNEHEEIGPRRRGASGGTDRDGDRQSDRRESRKHGPAPVRGSLQALSPLPGEGDSIVPGSLNPAAATADAAEARKLNRRHPWRLGDASETYLGRGGAFGGGGYSAVQLSGLSPGH